MFYNSIDSKYLKLDINETARRLNTKRGYTNELIKKCDGTLKKVIEGSFCAKETAVKINEEEIDLGFVKLKSRNLLKNLEGCESAFVFAITLGTNVDRLIKRLSVTSASEYFITDALASSYAEAAMDYAEEIIKNGRICSVRFSPGYGDLPLEIQKNVIEYIGAQKLLNIRLGESLIMTPTKSITAIMGIKNEKY